MSGMDLNVEQRKLLNEALLRGYSDFEEIRRLLWLEGEELHGISRSIAWEAGSGAVMEWATKNGKLAVLNKVLRESRPGNRWVKAYLESLAEQSKELPEVQFERFAPPPRPADSGLEAIIQKSSALAVATQWREAMRVAESRVCRIGAGKGNACGTGFLVGPDLVLTNCHVYRGVKGTAPIARFDYTATDSAVVDLPIQEPELAVSSEDLLDFALLRLAEPIGKKRGWFRPKWHEFTRDEVQLILQHPDGRPLELGIGRVIAVVASPQPRVTYTTNTEKGSSGSPAFTMDWQLVALHHWGIGGMNNVGIPMSAIWQKLVVKGFVPAA